MKQNSEHRCIELARCPRNDKVVFGKQMKGYSMRMPEGLGFCDALDWIAEYISKVYGPVVRKLDDGYIRQRLALTKSNIAYNQHYIERILGNPKSPQCNREAAIKFVKDHPDYFIPRPTDTPFEDLNRHNSVINGDNPDRKFISRFI